MSFEGHPKTLAMLARLPEGESHAGDKRRGWGEGSLAAARVFLTGYAERIQAQRSGFGEMD